MTGILLRKLIYLQRHVVIYEVQNRGVRAVDLRDPKTLLHLTESHHFGRSARAMHASPSTSSRQIQRLEEDLGQSPFVRDNRVVTLIEAGEELRTSAQQTLLQYQQLRHAIDQQGPSLSGELYAFCSVIAAYSHPSPILDCFRVAHPLVEIKSSTGDAADTVEKAVTGEADLAITGKPETPLGPVAFSMLENLAVVLVAPVFPCPVRDQVTVERPGWSTVPLIMADQGPVRRRIELWSRRHKISNPSIYATVGEHEAVMLMVALDCGVALLPEVVLENSPEPVRNWAMILERSDKQTPFKLGVCTQEKRLHEPLIDAFWKILPSH